MGNHYISDWEEIKVRMEQWWHGENSDSPIMLIQTPKSDALATSMMNDRWVKSSSGSFKDGRTLEESGSGTSWKDYWTDFDCLMKRYTKLFEANCYHAETYPRFFANLGVASLAVFLGCEPTFTQETIWYKHVFETIQEAVIHLDKDNPWLKWSLETTRKAKIYAKGDFMVGIPDLTEHLDVLASLFDTQELLFHMLDYPDEIQFLLQKVQEVWKAVYLMHYDIIKEKDGFSNYGPFQLLGKGKIAKLQCDMSAMISPDMFNEFAMPYLKDQTEWLDKSLYHLDGVDAVKHLDRILGLEDLNALQWTPGAGNSDGGDAQWDFIYEKALNAGKQIYALVSPSNITRFIKRFGCKGVYIVTSVANEQAAAGMIKDVSSLIKKTK